ncbi:protein claret segregational-like, partial [Temnothorax curvispinosus]|uniref:Kinesin-like protein n=1 Tax=Temnothorax curvispinosus TaxID=300111 RepID=A0A6J1Q983_9HYME
PLQPEVAQAAALSSTSSSDTDYSTHSDTRYDQLREKAEGLIIENQALQKSNEALKKSNEALQIRLREAEQANENVSRENSELKKERRTLLNQIQELSGKVRIMCRVRPPTPKETLENKPLCNICVKNDIIIDVKKSDGSSDARSCSGKLRETKQEFLFDRVFDRDSSQADVFEELSLLVQSALEGFNVCIFAYGQTNSGKTYTMEGSKEGECGLQTEGMIPKTVRHIFEQMKQLELHGWKYEIEASILEIYNERIVDLIHHDEFKKHEIRVDKNNKDMEVTNPQIKKIGSEEELHECLRTAQYNRRVAPTQSNERSSRSHSVTKIRLIGTNDTKKKVGSINLIDLAGSESVKHDLSPSTETKNINKSLSSLGNVISALSRNQEHIPYRDSKLTFLLMPSLSSNSKILMLLNISPLEECYLQTITTLRFGSAITSSNTGSIKERSPRHLRTPSP